MKNNFVAFINIKVKKEFESLNGGRFEDKKLFGYIQRAIDDLKLNPGSGTKIPKNLWPEKYTKEYKITNLWKYDLPNAWRLIYTLEADELQIVSFILEWFDHKSYEKRFSY